MFYFQKIIRDERFQAYTEPEDDSLWLPAQLLAATSSMLSQCEDTQVKYSQYSKNDTKLSDIIVFV